MKSHICLFISTVVIINKVYCSKLEPRLDRAFSLFNVVKFKNTGCQAASSAALQGVCFTNQQCSDKGGRADGNCAASFGVCCIISVSTCGSTVTQNCTYIENVGFPAARAEMGACNYMITRCSSDICQIRLDYKSFVLNQPSSGGGCGTNCGQCDTDSLAIIAGAGTGSSQTPPVICGNNDGQHMYIDAGTSAATAAQLTFTTAAAGGRWRVKVSQIECSSRSKAPNGCLQYFTENRSTVQTFNYGDGAGDCTAMGGCLPHNQNYRVCFRKNKGMCKINYTPSSRATGDSFRLSDAAIATANNAGNCAESANAGKDAAIVITNVEPNTPATTDKFCGNFLSIQDADTKNAVLTQDSAQFGFQVIALNSVTGAANVNVNQIVGFEMDATQVPC